MTAAVSQFVEIVRATWRQMFYCAYCGRETEHVCYARFTQEVYQCTVCQEERAFTVR